ncbi:transcription factor bHLH93-like [Ipomoea triloba]|uniref:transcription factor bHLH93-like n=1 Tax=Ipomoea triloba TaxID=35885 RepID=UPI00125D2718|nr:transcription factor bHLH93-like [Ipomoea triloba]
MEVNRHGLLEELIAPLNTTNEFFPNGWISSSFESSLLAAHQNHPPPSDFLLSSNSSLEDDDSTTFACPLADIFKKPRTPPPFPVEEVHGGGREPRQLLVTGFEAAKEEMKKKKKKKVEEGQPSKNLMAERRRRKRLHDRLSMLRSIVPKISKMDRTSIVADAIDYIKDLLHKINQLRQVRENPTGLFKPPPDDEVTNPTSSPKFDVERRHEDTRIEICCATRPGLMLSTVSTLEAIGLDIQHCVISCFTTDFSFQASCTEAMEHPTVVRRPEDIKQVLFKTAGYGGRCLYEK